MQIHEIRLESLMGHARSTVTLPSTGLVLVRAPNGRGKSALYEAVSLALYGETLRGTLPWVDGAVGAVGVRLTAHGQPLSVTRATTAGGKRSVAIQGAAAHGTATKAQADLDKLVTPLDVWRRTRVFRSRDLGHFASASDNDRKTFLERLLGLERFNEAYNEAKKQLHAVELRRARASALLSASQGDYQRALEDTRRRVEDDPTSESELSALDAEIAELEVSVTALSSEQSVLVKQATARAQARARRTMLKDACERARADHDSAAAGTCRTCGAAFPAEKLAPLKEKLAHAEDALRDASVQEQADAPAERVLSLEGELRDKHGRLRELLARRSELTARVQAQRSEHARMCAAFDALDMAEGRMFEHRLTMTKVEENFATMKLVVSTLSPQGVRAGLLADALRGIEMVCNSWLAKLGEGYEVQLTASRANADGSVSDKIGLMCRAGGDWKPYKALSTGQQRRHDVAMLLGLGEVASAVTADTGGTYFYDEMGDGLDKEGIEAFADALNELSADRCIVCITHSDQLADALHVTTALTIRDGAVVTVNGRTP